MLCNRLFDLYNGKYYYLIFTMQRESPSSLLKTEKYVAQKGKAFCQRADGLKSWAENWNRETWLFTNIPIPPNCFLKIHILFGSYDQIRITNNYRHVAGKKKSYLLEHLEMLDEKTQKDLYLAWKHTAGKHVDHRRGLKKMFGIIAMKIG